MNSRVCNRSAQAWSTPLDRVDRLNVSPQTDPTRDCQSVLVEIQIDPTDFNCLGISQVTSLPS